MILELKITVRILIIQKHRKYKRTAFKSLKKFHNSLQIFNNIGCKINQAFKKRVWEVERLSSAERLPTKKTLSFEESGLVC